MSTLKLTLSEKQIRKIKKAIKDKTEISFRISPASLGGPVTIQVTNTMAKRVEKNAKDGKGTVVKISKSNIKHAFAQDGSGLFSGLLKLAAPLAKMVVAAAKSVVKTVAPAFAEGASMALGSLGIDKLFEEGHKGGEINEPLMSELLKHLEKNKKVRDAGIQVLFGGPNGNKPQKFKVLDVLSRLDAKGKVSSLNLNGVRSIGTGQTGGFLGKLAAISIPALASMIGKLFGKGVNSQ